VSQRHLARATPLNLERQAMENDTDTYDRTTIVLHWFTAVSVVVLWIIGQTADWIPDGPVNTAY
jgi:cytochrome b561